MMNFMPRRRRIIVTGKVPTFLIVIFLLQYNIGIEMITFIIAAIFIPFFVKHPDFWYDDSL